MKRLLVFVLMLLTVSVYASPPTRVYTYTAGNVIQPSEVTANEDAIFRYLTAGVDTISPNSVDTLQLVADSVTTAKILDGTIVSADISATAAIPYSKLTLAGTLKGSDLASDIAINTTGSITTTSTATVSGLYIKGTISDKDGDFPSDTQLLVATAGLVNWQYPNTIYPPQTGHDDEVLSTDGTNVSWKEVKQDAVVVGVLADQVTTSAAEYDVTGSSQTLTLTREGKIMVMFNFEFVCAIAGTLTVYADVDGTDEGSNNFAMGAGVTRNVSYMCLTTADYAAGAHTVKMQLDYTTGAAAQTVSPESISYVGSYN
jgi:hypothetical protein